MENTPKPCSGTVSGNHEGWYGIVGVSPCGEYVAHESHIPCDVIETMDIPEPSTEEHTCTCRSEKCPCGDFISHKISEPCSAIA